MELSEPKDSDGQSEQDTERDVEKGIGEIAIETLTDRVSLKERLSHFTW